MEKVPSFMSFYVGFNQKIWPRFKVSLISNNPIIKSVWVLLDSNRHIYNEYDPS